MGISSSKFSKIALWGCLVIAILLSYVVFWYSDIGDTLDNGVLLAESIVKGKFLDYYEYASVNSSAYSVYPANYNILLYAVFAIWNLPTVILHITTDFDYMVSTGAMLWCKAIIPVALLGIALIVKKLTERLGGSDEDGTVAAFLSVTSLSVMVPALVASQYDCIALFFMLLGIYFYSKGKTVPFILMFAIAVPLKLFAIFIFIPLLLIRFKNVLHLLVMLLSVMVPSVLLELPFKGEPFYEAALGSQNGDAIELIVGANVKIGDFKINLFFIAYILICFICYMHREKSNISDTRLGVYFSFAVFAAFCILIPIRSYWIILFTPFLAILAGLRKGCRVLPILVDTLAGLGAGLFFLANHWIYNTGHIASHLVLYNVELKEGMEPKYGSFDYFIEDLGLWDMRFIFFAVFIGAVVFALWYLYPERNSYKTENSIGMNFYWALLARPIILIAVSATLIYCEFAAVPEVKFGETSYETVMDRNVMDTSKDFVVMRTLSFESDETLTEMTVHVDTYAYRSARALLGVRIFDDTDEIIWEDSIGIVLIEDDKATFDLDKLKVEAGKEYTLELYAIRPELADNGYVRPYLDADNKIAVTIR